MKWENTRIRQWLWFLGLYLAALLLVSLITGVLRWLIR